MPNSGPRFHFDLTTDAEYVANLAKCQYVVVNVQQCSLLHSMLYLHKRHFFLFMS